MKKGMKSLFCILPTVLLVVFAFSLVLFAGENADGSALKGSFVDPILPPDPFFTTTQPEPPLPQLAKGDVNGDGKVDIADAMLVFYHVAKKESISWDALLRTDADKSGEVDIADAMKIFYYVAKKIDTLE